VDPGNNQSGIIAEREGIMESLPLNTIYYGPPGTGKTYKAIEMLKRELGENYPYNPTRQEMGTRYWWMTSSPETWHWDKLFTDGQAEFGLAIMPNHFKR
jgi:hypothetical protein